MQRSAGLGWTLVLVAACSVADADPGDDAGPGAGDAQVGDDAAASGSSSGGVADDAGRDASTLEDGSSDAAIDGDVQGDAGEDDASGDAGDFDAGIDAGPSFDYSKKALNHLLLAGQSNALGVGGGTVLTTTAHASYPSLMFGSGVFPTTNCQHYHVGCTTYEARTSVVPLLENDTYDNAGSYRIETPASGAAHEIERLARNVYFPNVDPAQGGWRMLFSNHARSGNSYGMLRKGGAPHYWQGVPASTKLAFDDALDQVAAAKALADDAGWSYAVRGVFAVHGEANHNLLANYPGNDFADELRQMPRSDGQPGFVATYAAALQEWQRDYETSIQALTGQAEAVPLFVSQMTNWAWSNSPTGVATRSDIPLQQLAAHKAQPGKIVVVGPTYFLPFNTVNADKIHLTPAGTRRLGEYFGKAYAKTTFTGVPWEPLRPIAVTRNDRVITVRFAVPKPPLVLDTVRVSDPGAYGFVFVDDSGATPTISDVALDGADGVRITLAAAPTGGNRRIVYANRATPQAGSGPTTGPRGNLRDSDDTPSESGGELFNWSVAFEETVP